MLHGYVQRPVFARKRVVSVSHRIDKSSNRSNYRAKRKVRQFRVMLRFVRSMSTEILHFETEYFPSRIKPTVGSRLLREVVPCGRMTSTDSPSIHSNGH